MQDPDIVFANPGRFQEPRYCRLVKPIPAAVGSYWAAGVSLSMAIQTVSLDRSYGGVQGVHRQAGKETASDMTFSVDMPPYAEGAKLPVVVYLSGLTCTHANVTEIGEFRHACAEPGLAFVALRPPHTLQSWNEGVRR